MRKSAIKKLTKPAPKVAKAKKVECQRCFDEEGSNTCVRPAHKKPVVLKGKDRDGVLDAAYQKLKSAATVSSEYVPDRLGGYSEYYVHWDKKQVIAVLKALLETLA